MGRLLKPLSSLALWISVCAAYGVTPAPSSSVDRAPNGRARVTDTYATLPLTFEENRGQADPEARFVARGPGYKISLTGREAILILEKGRGAEAIVRMLLAGAKRDPRVRGENLLSTRTNYFIGNDPERWRTGVPHYGRVRYEDVYPGIDLLHYGKQRQLEYDFLISPGADPRNIRLEFRGVDAWRVDENGNLVLKTDGGELVQHKPIAYQETGGERKLIEADYELSLARLGSAKRTVGFRLGRYDNEKELIIDPVLTYSTYLGGSDHEDSPRIAVDSSGNAYITGSTLSADFPTLNPIQPGNAGNDDMFISKLNPTGTGLVYSTYVGGSNNDQANGIALDGAGNAYVVGTTGSTNFPTQNPLQFANAGSADVFVLKLNAAGSALVYSTYLGGSGLDRGLDIAVDSTGNAYLTGDTFSTNFPTVNPVQPANGGGGGTDAFMTKLNAAGSTLVYSTYLGGSGSEVGQGLAVDGAGSAYAVGNTQSANFPTANAFQPVFGGGAFITDAFLTKLNAAGDAFVYSTYLGGSGNDGATDVALDGASAIVVGFTGSPNFPVQNAFQPVKAGGNDAFVTKFAAAGDTLVFSTHFGGSGDDAAGGVAVAGPGSGAVSDILVAGGTESNDILLVSPFQSTNAGGSPPRDALFFRLELNGTLKASSYLGGNGIDDAHRIAVDPLGNSYLTGVTRSSNFPTTVGAFQTTLRTLNKLDAFVTKISEPTGPQNQPPVNSVPGPQTLSQQTGFLVFDAAHANVISISDPDAGSNQVRVTVEAANGTLTLGATTGLTFLSGDGDKDATMVFGGTIPNINNALNGLVFHASSDFSGTASLTITTNDQGNTGAGGPLSDTDTVSITVTPSADVSLSASHSPDPVDVGGTWVYTAVVTNNGPSPATGVVLTVAADVTLLAPPSSTQGSCIASVGFVTCNLGTLVRGASATVTIAGAFVKPGYFKTVGQVSLSEPDPNRSNNLAVDDTNVSGGEGYYFVDPFRAYDTREDSAPSGAGTGRLALQSSNPLSAGEERRFSIVGLVGVPTTATAVAVNVTVTQPTAEGFLALYPGGGSFPGVSTINYRPGQTRANNAIVLLGPAGDITVACGQASGTVHVILDVVGYFE